MLSRNWIWPTLAIADAVFGLGLKPRYNSTESIAAVPPAVSLSSSPIPVENGDEENRVRYTETEVSVDTHCHGCTPETVTYVDSHVFKLGKKTSSLWLTKL